MKRTRFSESQGVAILKQADTGIMVKDLCPEYGISDATYYNGKAKYGGLEASDLKRLKELEDELGKLKRMYADLALANRALKDLIEKMLTPTEKRAASRTMQATHGVFLARECAAFKFARLVYDHAPVDWHVRDQAIIEALNQLVEQHPR